MQSLATYRKAHGLSQEAFAALVSVDQSVISRIERGGGNKPSLRLAVEIEKVTGGAIPASAWVEAGDQ